MNLRKKTNKGHIISRTSCWFLGKLYDLALGQFPNTVQIETTNACNAKCVICPHTDMQRPVKYMKESVYKKIINECAKYNCYSIHLHNFGEPLLDKNIAKRVQYAKEKGIKIVKIFSNGSLIDAKKAHELVESGLNEIKISFDGATREEFEKVRFPLKFEEVINNIKQLVKIRDKNKSHLRITVTCCSTSDKSETIRMLENIVDEFSFGRIHNWADKKITSGEKTKVRKPCSRIWRTFTVLSSSEVALCCLDYEGKVIMGNVEKSSIYEIWHSSSYMNTRLLHKNSMQHRISICRNCSKSFW